jgi:bacterioferritin-associated ferredoxin
MTSARYTVILVHSTSHAIRAEKVLNMAGISSKLIPVPRQLGSDCGVCVRVARADREAALAALAVHAVEMDGVHDC